MKKAAYVLISLTVGLGVLQLIALAGQDSVGNRQDARRNVMRALEIAPSYEPAQELLLKIVR